MPAAPCNLETQHIYLIGLSSRTFRRSIGERRWKPEAGRVASDVGIECF